MKHLIARFGLPALAIALLLLAGLPGGALPLSAAPLAAVTGTPTEPPTPTSTVVASATPTPIAEPTVTPTPRPRPPSDSDVADPAITKSASVAEARVGDEVTFTLSVTNKGDATAQLLNDVAERWIREDPAQWMWFHKRWNLSAPRPGRIRKY